MDLIYDLIENDSRFEYFRGIDLEKNINLQDEDENTLAMLIAEYQIENPEDTLKMLELCKEQDINLQNENGYTLAMLIAEHQTKNSEITFKMI